MILLCLKTQKAEADISLVDFKSCFQLSQAVGTLYMNHSTDI